MLTVESLNAYYKQSHILRDLSLQVENNQTVTLLGRNGAGKTTTIRSIMGISSPRTEGHIEFNEHSLTDIPSNEIFDLGISWVPEERRVFPNLTVESNLQMGEGSSTTEENYEQVYNLFPRLDERRSQKAGTMSGGEQQMLTIGRALLSDPDLLLVDEPLEGLMPALVTDLEEVLRDLGSWDVSILIAEQQTATVLDIADRAYIIEKGQMVYEGDASELATDEDAQQRYLGVSMGDET
jgi:branched-chain amino acid transport system ATP-binding protein